MHEKSVDNCPRSRAIYSFINVNLTELMTLSLGGMECDCQVHQEMRTRKEEFNGKRTQLSFRKSVLVLLLLWKKLE